MSTCLYLARIFSRLANNSWFVTSLIGRDKIIFFNVSNNLMHLQKKIREEMVVRTQTKNKVCRINCQQLFNLFDIIVLYLLLSSGYVLVNTWKFKNFLNRLRTFQKWGWVFHWVSKHKTTDERWYYSFSLFCMETQWNTKPEFLKLLL